MMSAARSRIDLQVVFRSGRYFMMVRSVSPQMLTINGHLRLCGDFLANQTFNREFVQMNGVDRNTAALDILKDPVGYTVQVSRKKKSLGRRSVCDRLSVGAEIHRNYARKKTDAIKGIYDMTISLGKLDEVGDRIGLGRRHRVREISTNMNNDLSAHALTDPSTPESLK